MKTAEMWQTGT